MFTSNQEQNVSEFGLLSLVGLGRVIGSVLLSCLADWAEHPKASYPQLAHLGSSRMKSIKRFVAGFLAGLLALVLSSANIVFAPDFDEHPPVGGEVIAVSPLLILAPYLLLMAVVAVVLFAMWKGLLVGKMRLEHPTA
jgi:hypothetical protein